MAIIEAVIAQHAEEAAFLWILRDAAITAPHYRLEHFARLDERVEAHIDGLRIAGESGWQVCADQLTQFGEAGEVFAAGVLALEQRDAAKLQTVLAAAEASPEAARGFVSALGWVPAEALRGTVRQFLLAPSPFLRNMGIAACVLHRVDPGPMLESAVDDPDAGLRARARRAAGMLKRADLCPVLAASLADPDPACRFWAAWSAVLLGDQRGLPRLLEVAIKDQPWADRALQLALRAMPPAGGMGWLRSLAGDPAHRRRVVVGAGIIGDPVCMPWLIERMAEPALARVAGEAFSAITGIDIAYADLDRDPPAGFEAGPTEDPEDEDVGRDPDEDLPWPNPEAIAAWWHANGNRFPAGPRYLLGQPMTPDGLQAALRAGFQRQRAMAALEIALRNRAEPLFETRAPARRQQRALGIGRTP